MSFRYKILFLLTLLVFSADPSCLWATDYYVAPLSTDINSYALVNLGAPGNTGTITSPWDLYTALVTKSATIRETDTIWLRGGTMCFDDGTGRLPDFANTALFRVRMHGIPSDFIQIKTYPQEIVKIDGNHTGSNGCPVAPYPDKHPDILLFQGSGSPACPTLDQFGETNYNATWASIATTQVCYIELMSSTEADGNINPKGWLEITDSDTELRNLLVPAFPDGSRVNAPPYDDNNAGNDFAGSDREDNRPIGIHVLARGIHTINVIVHDALNGIGSFSAAFNYVSSGMSFANGLDSNTSAIKTTANTFPTLVASTFGSNLKAYWAMEEGSGTTAADSTANAHTLTTGGSGVAMAGAGTGQQYVLERSGTTLKSPYFDHTTTAYMTAADHADFRLGTGSWTLMVNWAVWYLPITGISNNGGFAQIHTAVAHRFVVGQTLKCQGITQPSNANGTETITSIVDSDDFVVGSTYNSAYVSSANDYCEAFDEAALVAKGDGGVIIDNTDVNQEYALTDLRFCYRGACHTFAHPIGHHRPHAKRTMTTISHDGSGTCRLFEDLWNTETWTCNGTYASGTSSNFYVGKLGSGADYNPHATTIAHIALVKGQALTLNSEVLPFWLAVCNAGAVSTEGYTGHGVYTQSTGSGSQTYRDYYIFSNFADGFHADGSGSPPTINYSIGPMAHWNDRFLISRGSSGALQNVDVTNTFTWRSPIEFLGLASSTTNTSNSVTNSVLTIATQPLLDMGNSASQGLQDFIASGNKFYSGTASQANVRQRKSNTAVDGSFNYSNNTYYVDTPGSISNFTFQGTDISFSTWQGKGATYDPSPSAEVDGNPTSGLPATPEEGCYPNTDDDGLAMVNVVNWRSASSATITDTCLRTTLGWDDDDIIQIRAAQNFLNDVVYNGTIGTGGISVSMLQADHATYTPYGTDLGGYSALNSFPLFGSFVVIRVGQTPPIIPILSDLSCSPTSLTGGNGGSCTVTLSAAAIGDTVVSITDDSSYLTLSGATVTVLDTATTANFTYSTTAPLTVQAAIITATLNAISLTSDITINPAISGQTVGHELLIRRD